VYDLRGVREDELPFMMFNLTRHFSGFWAKIQTNYRDATGVNHVTSAYFFLDTGATVSSIPSTLNPMISTTANPITVHAPGGAIVYPRAHFVFLDIDGRKYRTYPTVNNTGVYLLGLDILDHFQVVLDSSNGGILVSKF